MPDYRLMYLELMERMDFAIDVLETAQKKALQAYEDDTAELIDFDLEDDLEEE